MAIFDELKSIAKTLREADKIPQYEQILGVQAKLLEQQKLISDLESENKDLRERLTTKENLVAERNMYWSIKGGNKDGPFCTSCWDSEALLVRLHCSESHRGIQCPKCKIWTVRPTAYGIDPVDHWRHSGR